MADELYFNVRLEGVTRFTAKTHAEESGEAEIEIPTVILIEAGRSGWKDDPFRANMITEFRGGDAEDKADEHRFPTDEQLCKWLESNITDLRSQGFTVVRYKVNGLPIDWLNRINLPPD